MGHHAQITREALSPAILERSVATTTDIDAIHCAGHHIKARRKNHRVQCDLFSSHHDAIRRETLDGSVVQIHQLHVVLIEDFKVVSLRRQTSGQNLVIRAELVGNRRVVDPLANFFASKLGQRLVGFVVQQAVGVGVIR